MLIMTDERKITICRYLRKGDAFRMLSTVFAK